MIKKISFFVFVFILMNCAASCKKNYTVTFKYADGEIIQNITVEKNSTLELPTLECNDGFYYEWSNNKVELNDIKSDLEIVATLHECNKVVEYYIENELVKTETVKYTDIVEEPVIPTYYKNPIFTKTSIDNSTFGTYVYRYDLTYDIKTVLVTFVNEANEILKQNEIEYNNDSFPISFPVYNINGFYYEWDKTAEELVNLTEDVIVKATLKEASKVVKYYIDDELVKEETVLYSQHVSEPDFPEHTKNQDWLLEIKQNGKDYIYEYSLVYDMMGGKISYYDGNTKLNLEPSSYIYGDLIILPDCEKEGYQFMGWYISDISLYRYEEINGCNDGDIKLFARFVNTTEKEPLVLPETNYHFININKNPHSSGNGFVYQPVFPENAPYTSVTQYNWYTSDSTIATVSAYSSISAKNAGYCILTAIHKNDPSIKINCVIRSSSDGITFATIEEANARSLFTVTFVDKDGNILETQIVNKGGSVVPPTPPKYEGLAFNGWDKDIYNINEDTIIKATYIEGTNNYVGKKITIIGDSISTYQGYIPAEYSCFYPYPTADVNDVNQTWWKQVANKLGAGIFINNSYSGSCVAAGGSSATSNDVRLSTTIVGNQKPDVIIIYMGSNDCASGSVTAYHFTNSYKIMLDKLKLLCPDAEIILCTLPKSNLYSETRRIQFNEIISDYANQYSLKLVDLGSVDITDTLVDSAHPNKEGMTLVANKVIEELLENEEKE